MIPVLEVVVLRLVPTPVACQLTGLSTDKLREWTSRRTLFPADVRPKQKGSPAQFSWQTILILRIAVVLRDRFSVELQAHKIGFDALRERLSTSSFIALWGKRVALTGSGDYALVDDGAAPPEDALIIHLNPHLAVIRDGFALEGETAGQFDLFSLPAMHRAPTLEAGALNQAISSRRSA